jgi:hypothetical protein
MSQARRLLAAECNRYVNGQCSTRACVLRGTRATGVQDRTLSTCGYHEAVQEIDTARDLIKRLIYNDPNDYVADGVTVPQGWLKSAADFIAKTE